MVELNKLYRIEIRRAILALLWYLLRLIINKWGRNNKFRAIKPPISLNPDLFLRYSKMLMNAL